MTNDKHILGKQIDVNNASDTVWFTTSVSQSLFDVSLTKHWLISNTTATPSGTPSISVYVKSALNLSALHIMTVIPGIKQAGD